MKKKRKQQLAQADQVLFLTELAELTASGYSLAFGIDVLVSTHPNWANRLKQCQQRLASGQGLSAALLPLLNASLGIYLDLGQNHGRFEQTLSAIAVNLGRVLTYKRKIKQILTYPLLLLVFLLALVFGMETVLYPIFTTLAGANGQSTAGKQNLALLYLHGLFACVVFVSLALVLLFVYLSRQSAIKRLRLLSRLPVIGSLTKRLLSYLLAENLGLLLAAGLTVPDVIKRFANLNQAGKEGGLAVALAQSAQQGLGQGESLTEWLGRQPFLQPTLAAYFNRGLPSQDLGAYLTFYAQGEYRQFERQMSSLLALVQPLFFGLIGLTIVLLYLAMLLPLYRNLGGIVS
ncbi:ComG operon protein 2 [Fructobacillus pseudoficulneus]|uniref:ComG operon protein 2 n=1 Tax=Fructobacillus pseudoficulneus TaxID=220714 RepID=A0A3F3GS81_9LACO|nr:type II secretion system F family protein [Fructobacillus pseudoficulneus]GAP02476.1 ComG operon protein 2 [Fructobacillus pseudoficulneus]SEH37145.1 competence protein ComGB [Fructobacillus pseudoficulneus]